MDVAHQAERMSGCGKHYPILSDWNGHKADIRPYPQRVAGGHSRSLNPAQNPIRTVSSTVPSCPATEGRLVST